MFSPENAYVVEQAQGIKNPEGSNEAIDKRRDGGYSTGVIVHGMLCKGFCREPGRTCVFLCKGVPETEETRFEDEVQVVGSIHSTEEAG